MPSPDWLIERGIGETRAVLVENGEIVGSRILLDGQSRAGSVVGARLVSAGISGRNAVARANGGQEYLLPRGAPGCAEGGTITIEVTRESIPGAEPWKRPLARVSDSPIGSPPGLEGTDLPFPAPANVLAAVGWDDLIEEARGGIVRFPGGELAIEPTRAMTMIDVDGVGEPNELVLLGGSAAARAIRRLDIQGSIGIDLPTGASKQSRQAAAAAIDVHLPHPFERTAVNGFGFLQIVRPRRRASLIELAVDRAAFEARALLRRAAFEAPGAKTLVAHQAVIALLKERQEWLVTLAAQLGGPITLRADPKLTMSGGHAERS